ncbi:MAG: HrgA protein [Candidatus Desulfovibrio kirbyi]|uniref:HrgA protein n=1 Tax=Candidatus Desulfovibrio kirbyi TaxID=2696086 RepID=A0A6L2R4Q2_9BACT|nr:MAG: HrgA protein [Candidatus Desulfovibrio kirbyi]
MALKLANTVFDYLKGHSGEKFTARQIAEWIFATYPEECQAKKQNSQSVSTDAELITQLVSEIGAHQTRTQKRYPELKITEGRPRKYYYSEKSDSEEVEAAEGTPSKPAEGYGEYFLYPLLSQFLRNEYGIYSKRIDEKCSSNKQGPKGNHWLHPDVVGMEVLGEDWLQEVRDCVNKYSDKRMKLWSFEVKKLINRSNVRDCYLQAVSNSSWANFGYLVAAEIKVDQYTDKELQMLSAAHGIGVIRLDVNNPADSQVLIPARDRDDIDWDMINRLAKENKDFLEYVKLVKQFYQTGEARVKDWDVPDVAD